MAILIAGKPKFSDSLYQVSFNRISKILQYFKTLKKTNDYAKCSGDFVDQQNQLLWGTSMGLIGLSGKHEVWSWHF